MKITYKKPTILNALQISVLLKAVFIQTYADEGITSEFANFLTQQFSFKKIEEAINENTGQFIVAFYNENPIGVSVIKYNHTCPIRNIPVPDLDKLYVLQRFHGKGIGYGLLKMCEKEVKERGFNILNLEVYVKNERAVTFYKKQGFRSIGIVDFLIEDNIYKNYVMTKELEEGKK